MTPLETDAVRVVVNPQGGHLEEVEFRWEGRRLRPMHRAPWRDGEVLAPDTPTVLRSLAGDFLCAPFGDNDLDGGPPHGETANATWQPDGIGEAAGGGIAARFVLRPRVLGATVHKHITLRAGQPFVYQRHVFSGGQGLLPLAHHAMIHAPGGAALSFSPKAFGMTPPVPLEPDAALGRSILRYPQRFDGLDALSLADGGTVDARHYPFADNHEDLLLLAERPGARLGWSAALAARDGFLFLAIKDARQLPHTVLWMSNGGRDYPPWNGRHRGVLGIEEGCTCFHLGHRAALAANALTEAGYPTALALSPTSPLEVRYAFGAIPAPDGWERVATIALAPGCLRLGAAAGTLEIPFDTAFFGE